MLKWSIWQKTNLPNGEVWWWRMCPNGLSVHTPLPKGMKWLKWFYHPQEVLDVLAILPATGGGSGQIIINSPTMILQPVHLGDVTGLQQICTPEKQHVFLTELFSVKSPSPPSHQEKTHTHTHTHTHRFRRICCSPIITYSWLDNPPFFLYIKYRCTSSRGNAGYPATDSWWILRILPATWFTKA